MHGGRPPRARAGRPRAGACATPSSRSPLPRSRPPWPLEGVTARYAPEEPPVLSGFDLRLEPGGGSRSSGRAAPARRRSRTSCFASSTPSEGRVTIARPRRARATARRTFGGRSRSPARTRTSSTRRSARTSLLARPTATDAELEDALRRARLGDWVASLPDGLDTLVGEEGTQLSGGQRQRLSLARALLVRRAGAAPRRADGAPRPRDGRGRSMDDVLGGGRRALGPADHPSPGGPRSRRRGRLARTGIGCVGGECPRGKRYCAGWRRTTRSSAPAWPTPPGAPPSSRLGRRRVSGANSSKRLPTRSCRRPRSPGSSTARSPVRCRRSSRARSSATACSSASSPSSPPAASWSAS